MQNNKTERQIQTTTTKQDIKSGAILNQITTAKTHDLSIHIACIIVCICNVRLFCNINLHSKRLCSHVKPNKLAAEHKSMIMKFNSFS